MGTSKKSNTTRREKMKVLSAIVAAATASVTTEWPGVSVDNSCGSLWESEESIVNKTCTISAPNAQYQFAGNGAFVVDGNTFTGFDGVSGSVNVVVFYGQAEDADGNLDNSTCWDIDVSCSDYGGAYAGLYFMENVNDHRNAKNGNYNIQIAGVANGQTLSIQLNDNDGNAYSVQNITADFGVVSATEDAWGNQYSDDGSFTVEVDAEQPFGQLFQISVVQQPGNTGVLSMWSSTVA